LASPAVAKPVAKKRISLALQGGGTHGAFTWGAMERLLEDERIDFDGFSGTSAGAINGAMVVEGLIEGGPAGAITALDRFWRSMAAKGEAQGRPVGVIEDAAGALLVADDVGDIIWRVSPK
jgi:NTE family protein